MGGSPRAGILSTSACSTTVIQSVARSRHAHQDWRVGESPRQVYWQPTNVVLLS
jgi:hypothetical protein